MKLIKTRRNLVKVEKHDFVQKFTKVIEKLK